MGLWSWPLGQLLSPRFFKSVRKEGFLRSYFRGHKAPRGAHEVAGKLDLVKLVGQDQFGNMYYEDFDVDSRNQRRWVEYADYFLPIGITGDRVPVGWHGWMAHIYDDTPEDDLFVKHHYLKEHTGNLSYTPLAYLPPGHPGNPNRMAFIERLNTRRANPMLMPAVGAKTKGKKILVERKPLFEDPAQNL